MLAHLPHLRRHPIAVIAAAVLAIVAGFVLWRVILANGGDQRPMMPAQVVVAPAGPVLFIDSIEAIGTARANESVMLTAKVTDTVRRINVADGAVVEKGDILVELTNDEESALLAEAKANLTEAEQQYARISDLVSRGSYSRARLDEQTAARNAARAKVEAIAARLKDRLIRAPFAGVLGFRQVSPGTLVQPNTPIISIDDIDIIKLEFALPEIYLGALRPGLEVIARSAAYEDREFAGRVTGIDSRVDPATRTVTVRAEIDNPDHLLRAGMLLTVMVIRERADRLAVPEEAVIPVQDRQFVYVIKDGVAHQRDVVIGRRQPGYVEIIKGLKVGEIVAIEGIVRLFDGAPVTVQAARPAADVAS